MLNGMMLASIVALFSLVGAVPAPAPTAPTADQCLVKPPSCTREYRPHTCTYEAAGSEVQTFQGNNACEAASVARTSVCTATGAFDEAALKCVPTGPDAHDPTASCLVRPHFCTRELRPTSCSYEGIVYDGANKCVATSAARAAACEATGSFDVDALKCVPRLPVRALTTACSVEEVFCTMYYAPATCTYGGRTFDGSNRCQAAQAARASICAGEGAFDDAALVCATADAEMSPL